MDMIHKHMCLNEYSFNPLITSLTQTSCILAISQFFYILLKPVGQPGPAAQLLAGAVLGPSVLCRIDAIREFFIQPTSADYYQAFTHLFEIIFMFLIGLETDLSYLRRNLYVATVISSFGLILNIILGAVFSPVLVKLLRIPDNKTRFAFVIIIILANSSIPVAIRFSDDLKLDTSDVGRLAVASAVVNEMSCVLLASVWYALLSGKHVGYFVISVLLTGSLIGLNYYLAAWMDKSDRESKYVSNAYISIIYTLLLVVAFIIESCGYTSILHCYLVGLMFPRKGKTCRTLLSKFSYLVHNFLLPIYFGYMGFQFDVDLMHGISTILAVAITIILNFGGKLVGTLAACHYLKIPLNEGVMFALILSLKGHFEVLLINVDPNSGLWWDLKVHNALLAMVMLNTIIGGAIFNFAVKQEKRYLSHKLTSLEMHDLQSELRVMACTYGPRQCPGMLALISAFHGSKKAIISPYLMHLVELPEKRKTSKMYHELEEGDQYSDEDDYGGDDVIEINDAIDSFANDTKTVISIVKAVSSFAALNEDVCTGAEDKRTSIIFLPFHKHQRIDGQMEIYKEGIRTINQRVLRHAPCSVGVLVDRSVTGFHQPHGSNSIQQVAILFFGGPDDREALACAKWVNNHQQVNLTLVRFFPVKEQTPGSPNQENEALLTISTNDTDYAMDETSLVEFHNRYISSGKAGYLEKHVSNGAETASALRELSDGYSLFLVGKGGRSQSYIANLSEWEECPEIGVVGDFLASSDFNTKASVLIIQKHQHNTENSFRGA